MKSDKLPIIALAPMAGITDWPMRLLCSEYGCNYSTTEMVSAMGFLSAPDSLHVYRYLLAKDPNEVTPLVQIFGHEPQLMSQAAAKLTDMNAFAGIDINMGCPAQKVAGSGSGSALMKNLPLAAQVITLVRAATALPLSVKMRLGWDDESICAKELAHICEDCGVDLITVHGRTRMQQYSGEADWNKIAEVKQSVRIPVILNGDITSADDALRAIDLTGCDGVAVGRGALGNPFLFAQIKAAFEGKEIPQYPAEHVINTAIRHGEMMRAWKGEKSAVPEMRKHLCWYIRGQRGAAKLRTQLTAVSTLNEVYELLRNFVKEQNS
ncbi:MAG: tRNA dihydrouridine synthase DusB [Clostridia bacterium]|nr:tRNA dihydrouridine synthase DusB [Clostridia bacterium]